MVQTRMENRLDTVEKEVTEMKDWMGKMDSNLEAMREYVLELKNFFLNQQKEKGKAVVDPSPSVVNIGHRPMGDEMGTTEVASGPSVVGGMNIEQGTGRMDNLPRRLELPIFTTRLAG